MPDPNLYSASDDPNPDDYKILRKGSVYNIVGPHGREFSRFKSASTAGPRWEELTYTPWPYDSSAYTSGMRLWEMGIIEREHVGMRKLLTRSDTAPSAPTGAEESAETPEMSAQGDKSDGSESVVHESESTAESASSDPEPVRRPARESTPMQQSEKAMQQTLRPAKKSTRDESKKEAQPTKPASPEKSAPPRQPAKPRQQRLMFQENWEDYREPIKPDGKSSPAEGTDADTEDD